MAMREENDEITGYELDELMTLITNGENNPITIARVPPDHLEQVFEVAKKAGYYISGNTPAHGSSQDRKLVFRFRIS
jgi:hypothetical protein